MILDLLPVVQIQIKTRSQIEYVPPDTEKSEFVDFVDFGGAAFSVESVIWPTCRNSQWSAFDSFSLVS